MLTFYNLLMPKKLIENRVLSLHRVRPLFRNRICLALGNMATPSRSKFLPINLESLARGTADACLFQSPVEIAENTFVRQPLCPMSADQPVAWLTVFFFFAKSEIKSFQT